MPVLSAGFPRRILMSVDAVGGVWTYAMAMARGLSEAGVEVILGVLGPDPTPEQATEAAHVSGLRIVCTGLPLDWTATREQELDDVAGELKSLARHYDTDLVHLNAPAHAGRSPWHLPLVVVAHSCVGTWWHAVRAGPLPDDLAWRARRTQAGISIANAAVAPSRSFARDLQAAYGNIPVTAVLNGAEFPAIPASAERDIVLTAGRLWDPAKNTRVIDHAAGLSGTRIHAAGPVMGPNGEHASYEHLTLLGSLSKDDLTRWYARTGVFVSMSRYEPFGLAVLEAAQAGAALILSDIPTFRELWHGSALFVDPDDPVALREAVVHFKTQPLLRESFAQRARERARHFSRRRMVKGMLSIYRRTGRERTPRARVRSVA